jgi:hypothetical protein
VWLPLRSAESYAKGWSLIDRAKNINRGEIAHFAGTQPLVVSDPPGGNMDYETRIYLDCQNRGERVEFYPNLSDVTIAGNPNGFSICLKVSPNNFDVDPAGGGPQCLFSKRDDATTLQQ